ncbi:bacterial Ig-like domain-containing protein, partial [Lactococcus petauri]
GNAVDFSLVSVDASKVDTSKAGTYDVTYTYDGVTSTAKVTVKDKQALTPKPDQPYDTGNGEKSKEYTKDKKNNQNDSNKGILPATGEVNEMIFSIIGLLILGLVSIALLFKKKELKK